MTDKNNLTNDDCKLTDDQLSGVAGGWGASWSYEDEQNLRNEFLAANPDVTNPTDNDLNMFLEAKGLRERVDDDLVYATIVARVNYGTLNGA